MQVITSFTFFSWDKPRNLVRYSSSCIQCKDHHPSNITQVLPTWMIQQFACTHGQGHGPQNRWQHHFGMWSILIRIQVCGVTSGAMAMLKCIWQENCVRQETCETRVDYTTLVKLWHARGFNRRGRRKEGFLSPNFPISRWWTDRGWSVMVDAYEYAWMRMSTHIDI